MPACGIISRSFRPCPTLAALTSTRRSETHEKIWWLETWPITSFGPSSSGTPPRLGVMVIFPSAGSEATATGRRKLCLESILVISMVQQEAVTLVLSPSQKGVVSVRSCYCLASKCSHIVQTLASESSILGLGRYSVHTRMQAHEAL